jgi:hypothetical protein
VVVLVNRLRSLLGDAFVEWVLVGGAPPFTSAQQEVADVLCRACLPAGDQRGPLDARFRLSQFLRFDTAQGTTVLNTLRMRAGGDVPAVPPPTGDAVIDSLRALAVEVYCELLLPEDSPYFSLWSARESAVERAVARAIQEDADLPFHVGSGAGDAVSLQSSTGRGGGFRREFLGLQLIGHAWNLASLKEPVPSAEGLLREIPAAVIAARAAFTGKKTTATGLAFFTGVILPAGSELTFTWGQLRDSRWGDRPSWIHGLLGYHEDWTRVTLAATVPVEVRISEGSGAGGELPDPFSRHELEARIFQVRLALLLAWPGPEPPVLLPVWERFVEPLILTSWPRADRDVLHQLVDHPQVELTREQAAAWGSWIERLDSIPFRRLGVAPERLLRATAERRESSDSLIDAVIAWESLFGTETEVTFRVSAAMARLLRPPGQERRRLRTRLADIYRLRSKVVHGVEVDPQQLVQASQDAGTLAADALRALIEDRPDLIQLTSAERSTTILME